MSIPEGIRMNFDSMVDAAKRGRIALVETVYKGTKETAYAICLVNVTKQEDGEYYDMLPIATFCTTDPYELLEDPTKV